MVNQALNISTGRREVYSVIRETDCGCCKVLFNDVGKDEARRLAKKYKAIVGVREEFIQNSQ